LNNEMPICIVWSSCPVVRALGRGAVSMSQQ
jgi:hypothetical protein